MMQLRERRYFKGKIFLTYPTCIIQNKIEEEMDKNRFQIGQIKREVLSLIGTP